MTYSKLFDHQGNELCRGFLASSINRAAGVILERRYAKMNDGTILMSEESRWPNFDWTDSTWIQVDAMPEKVEFIGYYRAPKAVDAFAPDRIKPFSVFLAAHDLRLVWAGGVAPTYVGEFCFDHVTIMGGEPYSIWR